MQSNSVRAAASCVVGVLATCGLFCASTFAWLAVCVLAERHEAWDSSSYFAVALPLLALASTIASWKRPVHFWRWPTAIVLGQLLGLGITTHSAPTLGPLVIVPLAIMFLALYVLSAFAERRRRRESSG